MLIRRTLKSIVEKYANAESAVSTQELAYRVLKTAIRKNVLRPGSRIIEAEVANELGISRTPVREALRQLEAEGLVREGSSGGVVVTTVDYDDALAIYEVRLPLEGLAARLAATRATDSEIEVLESVARSWSGVNSSDEKVSFHIEVARASRNPWLLKVLTSLQEYTDCFHLLSFLKQGRRDEATAEHIRIAEAIRARDAQLAEQLACEHIEKSRRALIDVFASMELIGKESDSDC